MDDFAIKPTGPLNITIKPYTDVYIREMIEFSKDDFLTIMTSMNAPYCYHCDGVAIIEERYHPKEDEFEYADKAIILRLHYCIMPFTKTIKSSTNLELRLIPTTSPLYIDIAKMIKKMNKGGAGK